VLEQIVPPRVAVAESFGDLPDAKLLPEEEAVIARAVPRRRREFAVGRACARAALAQLGEPPVPILRGPRNEPQWPAGIAGSITHCAGYRAAVAARTAEVVTLGLDAEPDEALPAGVLAVISRPRERAQLAALAAACPDAACPDAACPDAARPEAVCWDRLLFCAKEAVYKAWFPLAQEWLGFDDAEITIDAGNTFTARLLVPGPLVAGAPLTSLRGRWLAARGLLITGIALPAP
jgi:4'-phosphopantetheinyl transferase EntD